MRRRFDRAQRPDHWIYLDRSWAQRLGVLRTAGTYRVRSRDLARRLAQETLWVDEAGTVHALGAAYGPGIAATRSHSAGSHNREHRDGFPAWARSGS